MAVEAFPLCWPHDWARTPAVQRTRAVFRTTFDNARQHLLLEVQRLGGRDTILSTSVPLRLDGQPRSDWARTHIEDPGVAVYFMLRGKQHVMACDRYVAVFENLRAVGLSIACLRGLQRYGASTILARAFTGFRSLPAPGAKRSCWDVLGIQRAMSANGGLSAEARTTLIGQIDTAYRARARLVHPDSGGTDAQMSALNQAREDALREMGA